MVLCLFLSVEGYSQRNYLIKGKVLNEFQIPIENAHVKLLNNNQGTVTDKDGVFIMSNISSGSYTVKISFIGYLPQTLSVTVDDLNVTNLNFYMQPNFEELEGVTLVTQSKKSKLEATAQAVSVIDTKEAVLKSGDLAEVMSQTQGVSIRRGGGMGDKVTFSLNGLSGNQIRFFLDGIPLKYQGYNFGFAVIPVNFINRVEIYKGVVPAKYGADALGGVVDLISPKITAGFKGSAYYQTGSFGTHRSAVSFQNLNTDTGFLISGNVFYDYAKNNYKVDVDVADELGKLSNVNVPRFNDAYQGYGANLSFGFIDKSWAKNFIIKGFITDYTKEIQNNYLMTGLPYGEVIAFRKSVGSIITYDKAMSNQILLEATIGYNYSKRQFRDVSNCVYNWFGECFSINNVPGEVISQFSNGASNQFTWNNTLFSRINTTWKISDMQTLQATIAPNFVNQKGDEEFATTYDPTNEKRELITWVNGIEYRVNTTNNSFKNILFLKNYYQKIKSEQIILPANYIATRKRNVHYFGFGNGLKYNLNQKISTKLTYEYAVRLPQPDELFGDGQFIVSNLALKPERSHNANLEFSLKKQEISHSQWKLYTNLFLRKTNDLILFVPGLDRDNSFQNVLKATSIGGEVSGKWRSKDNKFQLSANGTYQDFYNNSKEGDFESFSGDRIPNKPYFFANASSKYIFNSVLQTNDKLSAFIDARYIHDFFISWESAGVDKLTIPNQKLYNLGVTYDCKINNLKYAISAEAQNITNEKNFDFYGVQKPGRAFYIKLVTQF